MRALDYALRQGWIGLRRGGSASLLAIVAIALTLMVLGALLVVTWNAERLLAQWTASAELAVYLRDDASSEQRGAIESLVDGSGIASSREYVSKADALARFRKAFGGVASLADGFADNPFPASVDARVRPGAGHRVTALSRRLAEMPGVADVNYDGEWLGAFGLAVQRASRVALGLALIMGLAAGVTVAAVVRLGLHSRQDEIEIMTLVGSPLSFIRGPFVAQGLLQGGLGAVVALAVLGTVFLVARAWWGHELTALVDGAPIAFLPARFCVALIIGGMALGSAGGIVASRHAVR